MHLGEEVSIWVISDVYDGVFWKEMVAGLRLEEQMVEFERDVGEVKTKGSMHENWGDEGRKSRQRWRSVPMMGKVDGDLIWESPAGGRNQNSKFSQCHDILRPTVITKSFNPGRMMLWFGEFSEFHSTLLWGNPGRMRQCSRWEKMFSYFVSTENGKKHTYLNRRKKGKSKGNPELPAMACEKERLNMGF